MNSVEPTPFDVSQLFLETHCSSGLRESSGVRTIGVPARVRDNRMPRRDASRRKAIYARGNQGRR